MCKRWDRSGGVATELKGENIDFNAQDCCFQRLHPFHGLVTAINHLNHGVGQELPTVHKT